MRYNPKVNLSALNNEPATALNTIFINADSDYLNLSFASLPAIDNLAVYWDYRQVRNSVVKYAKLKRYMLLTLFS